MSWYLLKITQVILVSWMNSGIGLRLSPSPVMQFDILMQIQHEFASKCVLTRMAVQSFLNAQRFALPLFSLSLIIIITNASMENMNLQISLIRNKEIRCSTQVWKTNCTSVTSK